MIIYAILKLKEVYYDEIKINPNPSGIRGRWARNLAEQTAQDHRTQRIGNLSDSQNPRWRYRRHPRPARPRIRS